MTFIKMLIGLPLLVILLVFAFMNNDFATFNMWPFYVEVTVSLSVAIVFLFVIGFLCGTFFSWLSYAPRLRKQKKQNKKLSKAQMKLNEKVSGLQENIDCLKDKVPEQERPSFMDRIFNRKKVCE